MERWGSLATLKPQWMAVCAHYEGARQLKWQRRATPERVGCAGHHENTNREVLCGRHLSAVCKSAARKDVFFFLSHSPPPHFKTQPHWHNCVLLYHFYFVLCVEDPLILRKNSQVLRETGTSTWVPPGCRSPSRGFSLNDPAEQIYWHESRDSTLWPW